MALSDDVWKVRTTMTNEPSSNFCLLVHKVTTKAHDLYTAIMRMPWVEEEFATSFAIVRR
jgi:hypothetical protein